MADLPDEDASAERAGAPPLAGGFACQTFGARRGWELDAKSWTLEMRRVGVARRSATAGAMMDGKNPPLRTWLPPIQMEFQP